MYIVKKCPANRSADITSAFLNADIHEDDTVLVTPPPILVNMNIVKPNTVWHVKTATYELREAPRNEINKPRQT